MTTHYSPEREKENWIQVKAKLIARFGQVRKAALYFGCHPGALRAAVVGQCPRLAERMRKESVL